MEFPSVNSAIKTDICVVVEDTQQGIQRDRIWSDGAEEFLRKIHKHGLHLTIIGPRIPYRLGSKKNVRFFDRHDVIGMKELEISKKQKIELRVLSRKSKSWFRIRTEACLVIGNDGVWPAKFDGWTSGGLLTSDAFQKWIYEYHKIPANRIAFLGSQNFIIRSAIQALKMGANRTFVIEPENTTKCFRSYEDLFESMGGRILRNHQIIKIETDHESGQKKIFIKNEKGTMIMEVGALVVGHCNDEHINSPKYWKRGLYYVQRRIHPLDKISDEETWFDIYDWEEMYWRITRKFGISDQKQSESALLHLKQLKKNATKYKKEKKSLEYSGKILARNSLSMIQTSVSVPKNLKKPNPIASLECFESIPCRACADACPENAIEIKTLINEPTLIEDACTGCGACVAACPTSSAIMLQESKIPGKFKYVFADRLTRKFNENSQVQLLNRKGEFLGMGKVVQTQVYEKFINQLVTVEGSDVFTWDARRIVQAQTSVQDLPDITDDKYCWVQVNGVKRMALKEVPISIALWKLGHQRFEDAMLCSTGNCGLCEVEVNGKKTFACKIKLDDGMSIQFSKLDENKLVKNPLCACRQIEAKELLAPTLEGVSLNCMIEKTGFGSGSCHGRWCSQSIEFATTSDKLRPSFHGYDHSPWRDIVLKDIFEDKKD